MTTPESELGARRGLFRRRRRLEPGVIEGRVRIDRRTKNLVHRLHPGEIAVIFHDDLDQLSAEGLVERGAAAVINCHHSITGRYPNAGPLVLARAQVPLIDSVGEDIAERVGEGDTVRIVGGEIYRGGTLVGTGDLLTGDALQEAIARATRSMGEELERFVRNTMEYLAAERDLVLQGAGVPDLRSIVQDKPCVVVVRGHEYRKDLQTLRAYIREMKPVLIAVDGAADAMLEEGLKPRIIVGDMDSISTNALTCGARIIVHAYPDGRAPGLDRVRALGIDADVFASGGTSEDMALLLAYENGADLIVAVGAHDNMVEFLDKGRGGMASTFVTRLKVGPKLVDAKGVNRLYRSAARVSDIVLLIVAMLVTIGSAAAVSPGLRLFWQGLWDLIVDTWRQIF